jgi:hypothetical protein
MSDPVLDRRRGRSEMVHGRRGKDGQSGVGVVVAGRRWGGTSGDNLDHGEADLAGDELDR